MRHYQLDDQLHNHLIQYLHFVVGSEVLQHLVLLVRWLLVHYVVWEQGSWIVSSILWKSVSIMILLVDILLRKGVRSFSRIFGRVHVSMRICSKEIENHNLIVMKQVLETFQVLTLIIQQLLNHAWVERSRPAWVWIWKIPSKSILDGLIQFRFKIINWVIITY